MTVQEKTTKLLDIAAEKKNEIAKVNRRIIAHLL
jgi:hypothetical protein